MDEEDDEGGEGELDDAIAVEERTDQKVERPRRFRVILLNDDYTTQDFVIQVLQSIFNKSFPDAVALMLQVHYKGQAVCGIYPAQIAETKVAAVHARARAAGFPLRCAMEPE